MAKGEPGRLLDQRCLLIQNCYFCFLFVQLAQLAQVPKLLNLLSLEGRGGRRAAQGAAGSPAAAAQRRSHPDPLHGLLFRREEFCAS